jgi:hypothetical protein
MGPEEDRVGAAGQKLQYFAENRGKGDFLVVHKFSESEGSVRE